MHGGAPSTKDPNGAPGARRTYTGVGYWLVQLIGSAILAILGLGGSLYIVLVGNPAGVPSDVEPGDIMFMMLTGVVFLATFIWLLVQFFSASKEQRAVQAWAIMQQHSANLSRDSRPIPSPRAIGNDVRSLRTASAARGGQLPIEEIERLQALRPEVPYPGDLAKIPRPALPVPPEVAAQRQSDDHDAAALIGAPLASARRAVRGLTVAARIVGWAAVALFLLLTFAPLPFLDAAVVIWTLFAWAALRAARGVAEDVLTARGRRIALDWMSDPVRARRGLPTPLTTFLSAPLGAWWSLLVWPVETFGLLFVLGGALNLASAGDDRHSFIAMISVGGALVLVGIVLWVVRGRLQAAGAERLRAARGPRLAEDMRRL